MVVSLRPHISAGLLDWSRRPNRALKQKVPSSACLLITVCRAKLLDGDVRGTRLLKYVEARGCSEAVAESRVEHRFAVILCADVVGYSRLMGIDEEGL